VLVEARQLHLIHADWRLEHARHHAELARSSSRDEWGKNNLVEAARLAVAACEHLRLAALK